MGRKSGMASSGQCDGKADTATVDCFQNPKPSFGRDWPTALRDQNRPYGCNDAPSSPCPHLSLAPAAPPHKVWRFRRLRPEGSAICRIVSGGEHRPDIDGYGQAALDPGAEGAQQCFGPRRENHDGPAEQTGVLAARRVLVWRGPGLWRGQMRQTTAEVHPDEDKATSSGAARPKGGRPFWLPRGRLRSNIVASACR